MSGRAALASPRASGRARPTGVCRRHAASRCQRHRFEKEAVFTRIDWGRHIEFAPTFWLLRLFLPRFVFRLEAIDGGRRRFVAEIVVRTGPIGARLNRRESDAVRKHIHIVGGNLRRFAEGHSARGRELAPPPGVP